VKDLSAYIEGLSPEKRALFEAMLAEKKQSKRATQGQSIPRRQASGAAPLSFAQQRLWFFDQFEPGTPAYNIPLAVKITGPLDVAALHSSLNAIVARHATLRTTFKVADGVPVQEIAPELTLSLPVVDLRDQPQADVLELATADNLQPYDLINGPLIRGQLLRTADLEHVLLLNMHHIVSDGWSLGVLVREMGTFYEAFSKADGAAAAIPELPIQYADYAVWQRESLRPGAPGEALDEKLAYWKKQLAGPLPVLELPTDRPRPAVQTYRGARHFVALPKTLTEALRSLSREEGVTLFVTLLAAFQTLLQRYTAQNDIIVGSPIAGRNRSELEGLIGLFVNSLALRVDLHGNPSFRELLQRVREVSLDADAHQEAPFEKLVEVLAPERNLSQNPLFQVMFVFQTAPLGDLSVSGLTLTPLDVESGTAKLDLSVELYDRADGIGGWFEYNSDLFDAPTIARMAGHFQALLESVVDDRSRRLSDLPMLSAAERRQLVVEWNATAIDYPDADSTLHHLMESQAARTPDAVAVIFEDQRLSYRELNARANQLAHHLQTLGVGGNTQGEVRVGVCVEGSVELAIALLGVLKAGGTYVPIDPTYPQDRLQFMLQDTQTPVLLTQQQLVNHLPEHSAVVLCLDTDWPTIAQSSTQNAISRATGDTIAYIIYTSGSTGKPKGVMVPHRGAINNLAWRQQSWPLTANDRMLLNYSLSFDPSVWSIFWPLSAGAQLVLVRPEVRYDSAALVRVIAEQGVTVFGASPSQHAVLLDEPGITACTALRYVVSGGESLSGELQQRFHAKLPALLCNAYGPTEATIDTTFWVCPRTDDPQAAPIGRPLPNVQVYVLDPQMQPVPVGVPGEVYIGGVQLARGYLNRPELTAEKFVPNPFSGCSQGMPGTRLYRTGDRARFLPDGVLDFLGRIDNQVKIRGFRIELGEIESLLVQHPGVREAVVDARTVRANDKRLVAYIVPKEEQTNKELAEKQELVAELRAQLAATLPGYMIPTAFMMLEQIPLSPNGKADRRALPDPDGLRPDLAAGYVAPRSEIERSIAAIWQEVLQVEKVGTRDNFFDLGGHSLLMVQVHSKLRDLVEREITMVDLFKYPTISTLAEFLSDEQSGLSSAQSGIDRAKARRESQAVGATDVAIIGMALRFPGANTPEQFWENLRDGVESISFFSDEEVLASGVSPERINDPNYIKAEAYVEDIELFDAAFFGYNPREAERLDPQQRFFLECAWHAMEHAGYDTQQFNGRVGVFGGVNMSSYLLNNMSQDYDLLDVMSNYHLRSLLLAGNINDFLCQRVSYHMQLDGPSVNIQTACSSSLVAVHTAAQSLIGHECDMAMAGGIQIRVPQKMGYMYLAGGVPSPDGHCRPFDINAKGTVHANGVGIVVLKRLDDALQDGDQIYGVIKGSAVNNDGAMKVGFTAPSVEGQAKVIAEALAVADIDPETISYVEAHGTATEIGDPIEIAALTQAFRAGTSKKGYCRIGSVKSNLGHLDQASGVAGLIKTVLALKHEQIPPSLHYTAPNPKIDFANSPFYVNGTLSDWKRGETPRRAGVSSFAIGGTNAHVVLEEAPLTQPSGESRSAQLLVLSAKTATALEAATDNLAAYLKDQPEVKLADVAYTLQRGRRAFPHRRIVVCADHQDAITALQSRDPQRILTGEQETIDRPVALMFTGQGAQYPNMGRDLYEAEPVFRQHVDRCCTLLQPHLHPEGTLDLRAVLYPGDPTADTAPQLEQTSLAQPALFVIEYALAQLWLSWGIKPQAMIGHSIGEYVAACLAEVFTLEDALKLVAARGRLMQSVPSGSMLSVPLPESAIRPLLSAELSLAAINSANLCVVAGPAEAIDALTQQLGAQGVECRPLHTSHAFHSPMMDPILDQFTAQFAGMKLNPPTIPYISNVTGEWITAEQACDPRYWATHLRQTVRCADGLRTLLAESERVLLEIGPGQTLATFARQHPAKAPEQIILTSLRRPHERGSDVTNLLTTLGKCWLAGVTIDWAGFYNGERRQRLVLPGYAFQRQRYWVEPGKRARQTAPSQGGPLDKKLNLSDWFYQPVWKPSVLAAATDNALADRTLTWLVLTDEQGLAAQLVERLRQHNQTVIAVEAGACFSRLDTWRYTLNPAQREDYGRLLAELREGGTLPERIVHAWSITPALTTNASTDRFGAAQARGFDSLLLLTQALSDQHLTNALQIAVVSNGTQAINGDEALQPEKAPLLGLCKVIPQEYRNLTCQSIDVTLPQAGSWQATWLIDRLVAELAGKPTDVVVAYRSRQRWTQHFEAARLNATKHQSVRLQQHGVYLITGGLGNLGLLLAEHLAHTVQARLVLLGRSGLPSRESWSHWLTTHGEQDATSRKIRGVQALEALGAEVLIISADVADAGLVRAAIDQTYARFGALHGVIHAAGVVGEQGSRTIHETNPAEAAGQFQAKAYGTYALEQALQGRSLDFCLLMSSLSAVLGGLGFGAYAGANLFLDQFAHEHNRADAVPWLSVNWDAVLTSSDLAPHLSSMARLSLTGAELIQAFERVLTTDGVTQLVVSTGDLQARIDQWISRASEDAAEPQAPPAGPSYARPALQNAYVAPRNGIEQMITEIWQEVLGVDQIGVHDNFFELGGHSLLATQAVTRLREVFQVEIPLRSFLEEATIANVAEAVAQSQVAQTDTDELARLLAQLEAMSDEEAQQASAATDHTPDQVHPEDLARLLAQLETSSADGQAPVAQPAPPSPDSTRPLPSFAADSIIEITPVTNSATAEQHFQKLSEPAMIGRMQLKNRMIMAPMECGFGSTEGAVTQQMLDYYEERARGGVGLVVTEATCVDAPVGRLAARQNLIHDDRYIAGLTQLAAAIQRHQAKAALQLFHAGRRASAQITGQQPVAPSSVGNHWGEKPRELSSAEITQIVTRFADGAARARQAGFDAVEIHAAHGYLISQFLSPLYNQRQDQYGGSIENRARLLIEIITAIKERVGRDFPVWCRLSAMEYVVDGSIAPAEGGITLAETQHVAQLAEQVGADAIHVSASNIGQVRMHPMAWPAGVMVPLAEAIKQAVSIPVIAVGRIAPDLAEQALQAGQADFIAFGRALIADPNLPLKLTSGRAQEITPCIYCWTCLETVSNPGGATCPVNARFGKERQYQLQPAAQPKRVVVVGGGLSGMETARVAALRGHNVTLFEQADELGGQARLTTQPEIYHATVMTYRDHLAQQLANLGVTVRLRERFTPELIDQLQPDAIVLANGAHMALPKLPGLQAKHSLTASDVLAGAATGARVVVVGAEPTGCATALRLATQGKHVTLVSDNHQLITTIGPSMADALLREVAAKGVLIRTGTTCEAITAEGITVSNKRGERRVIAADTIVFAGVAQPNSALRAALEATGTPVFQVGDSAAPGNIGAAVDDGYRAALAI
jgi:amino acid adenylation domain-containing protein